MVEDTRRRGLRDHISKIDLRKAIIRRTYEDDLAEGTGGEEQVDPVLVLADLDVEMGGDDAGLVQAAVELDDDLARTVVVDDFEVTDVA